MHHAFITNKVNKKRYQEVGWPKGKNFLKLSEDEPEEWHSVASTKNILGYECKGALRITGKNDSILVWYSEALGTGFGDFYSYSLPGVCLEIYNQDANLHLYATEISKENYTIVFPDKSQIKPKEYSSVY